MSDSDGSPTTSSRKRPHQFFEYVESAKRAKKSLTPVEQWYVLHNMVQDTLACIAELAGSLVDEDGTNMLSVHNSKSIRTLHKNCVFCLRLCEKMIASPITKGRFLLVCLTVVQLLPTPLLFRKEFYAVVFQSFELLLQWDAEGFELLLRALLGGEEGKSLKSFILNPYQETGETLSFALLPSYLYDVPLQEGGVREKLFHSCVEASTNGSKVCLLYHFVHVMEQLCRQNLLLRLSPSIASTLVDISCSLLAVQDERKFEGGSVDSLCARTTGQLLCWFSRNSVLSLSRHGLQLLYYLVQRIEMSPDSQKNDSWERYLLRHMVDDNALPSSKGNKEGTHWFGGILHPGLGLLDMIMKCIFRLIREASSSTSVSQCRSVLSLIECLVAVVRKAYERSPNEVSRNVFLVALRLNFPAFLQDLIVDASESTGAHFLIFRLQTDAAGISLGVLSHFFSVFPTTSLRGVLDEILHQFSQRCHSSRLGFVTGFLSLAICYHACGQPIPSAEMTAASQALREIMSDTTVVQQCFPGVMRSFVVLLSLVPSCQEDLSLWRDLVGGMKLCSSVVHLLHYQLEGVFLSQLIEAAIRYIVLGARHQNPLTEDLMDCVHSFFHEARKSVELRAMMLNGAASGLWHNSIKLLQFSGSAEKIFIPLNSHILDYTQIDLFFSCLNTYLWLLQPYEDVIADITADAHLGGSTVPNLALMSPVLTTFSEFQVHLYVALRAVEEWSHDAGVEHVCQRWVNSMSPPAVVDVDDEVSFQDLKKSVFGVVSEKHNHVFPSLIALLNKMSRNTDVHHSLTSLRRAACASLCFYSSSEYTDDMKTLFLEHILHEDCYITRCGYGAFAVSVMDERGISFVSLCSQKFADVWQEGIADENSRSVIFLLHAFNPERREQVLLSMGVPSLHCLMVTRRNNASVGNSSVRRLLCAAIEFLAKRVSNPQRNSSTFYAVMMHFLAQEAVGDLLACLQWCESDVYRYEPHLIPKIASIFSERINENYVVGLLFFFGVTLNALDQVVGTSLWEEIYSALRGMPLYKRVANDVPVDALQNGAVVAKLLWKPDCMSASERDTLLDIVENRLMGLHSDDLQRALRRGIFFLLSLEGESQMQLGLKEGESVWHKEVESCSAFFVALRQIISLIPLRKIERNSFRHVPESSHAPEELTKHVFLVLDMNLKLTNVDVLAMRFFSTSISCLTTTRRRWLLALRSLVLFLGTEVTLLAPHLSSTLKTYSMDPQLVGLIASVWLALLQKCTREYLQEQLPSILIELLSLETKCWHHPLGMSSLELAVLHLYQNSSGKNIWMSIQTVFPFVSTVIQRLNTREKFSYRLAIPDALQGFLVLWNRYSADGKLLMIKGFKLYLESLSPTERNNVSVSHPAGLVLQGLLQSVKEFDEEDANILLCVVGLLGATSVNFAVSYSKDSLRVHQAFDDTPKQRIMNLDFDASLYVSWRKIFFTVLNNFLPHALSSAGVTVHRYAAFASQELIRVGVERENNGSSRLDKFHDKLHRYTWWKDLHPESQQLIKAFVSTDYILQRRSESKFNDDTHQGWLYGFYYELSELSTQRIKALVTPLYSVTKHFSPLLAWLFPYVVLDALQNSSSTPIIVKQFNYLYKNRNDTNNKERILTCLKLFENLSQSRWNLMYIALRKPTNIDVSFDSCDSLVSCIYSLLHETQWQEDDKPSWVHRAVASLSIGNALMALRFIESQRYLPNLQTVQTLIGKEVLRSIFVHLGDYDSAKSIYQGLSVINPSESAFICERNGEWSSAIQNCELALQKDQNSISHQVTLLHCLRQLGQLQLASSYAENLLRKSSSDLTSQARRNIELDANEAAWRLGDWSTISEREENANTVATLAFPVLHWIRVVRGIAPASSFFLSAQRQRRKLVTLIQNSCAEDYAQINPYIATLHGLADLESTVRLLESNGGISRGQHNAKLLSSIACELQHRLEWVEDTLEVKEPILSLHRCIFNELSLQRCIPSLLETHMNILRERGYLDAALSVAKQSFSTDSSPALPFLAPTSELLYETGSKLQAMAFVSHTIETTRKPDVKSKLLLLLTDWQQDANDQLQEDTIRAYEMAISVYPSVLAHHKLALFYEKLFLESEQNISGGGGGCDRHFSALKAVEHFGKALLIGCETLLVSLPRMLTLWLDSVYELAILDRKKPKGVSKRGAAESNGSVPDSTAKNNEQTISEFNLVIKKLVVSDNGIPLAYLVTALPQLLSRLEHPHHEVVSIISDIVGRLLRVFQQQCLWHVLPIVFGKPESTANIVKERILNRFAQSPNTAAVRRNAERIFECLISLCTCPPANFKPGAKLTKMPFMEDVSSLLTTFDFILPTLANMTPDYAKGKDEKDIFPNCSTFRGFSDTVVLMKSKQQPKRIQVVSSDGSLVPFLCKADDEPRKDIRMMDLAALINKFLLSDSNARRRQLALRRYTVAALSNKCALIEWVKDLSPFYSLVLGAYQLSHVGVDERKIKTWYDEAKAKNAKKVDLLRRTILPVFPAIFHSWFDKQFAGNEDWYRARLLYSESSALWSMAGHIVGLGDRHGENILLNHRTGEVMHVDFAEMFDSAEMLPVPELVRFRLTPNVIDGMGVVGTEGAFRAVCSIALQCQMKNSNALMSIAETHLYEPLNKCSKFSIERMSRRLRGYLDFYNLQTRSVFPLSTVALNAEGQVSKLISHSSSLENLSEMYTWWRPWI